MAMSKRGWMVRAMGAGAVLVGVSGSTLGQVAREAAREAAGAMLEPALPEAQARFDGHKVVRVAMRDARDVRTMLALSDDPWTCNWDGVSPGSVDFRVAPDAFEALSGSGLKFKVVIEDVQAAIDSERPRFLPRDASWYADYKQYTEVDAYLNGLVAARPDLASRVTLTPNSVQGRALPCIRISSAPAGTKPAIMVIGCQHAREWITVMSTTYAADQLVSQYATDPAIKSIVDNYEVFVVPITNPDGYVYTWATNRLWRKNRRANTGGTFGVDLNRNWAAGFNGPGSSTSPSSDIYHGPSAFSEPCTTAIKNFVDAHANLSLFFDIHSFSELVLSPWGNTLNQPPDARAYDQLTAAVQDAIYAQSGVPYLAGSTYRTIYPASGTSDDWTYQAHGFLSIALELRGNGGDPSGFTLPAAQILPAAQEWFAGFKAAAQWEQANPIAVIFPNTRPTTINTGSPTSVVVQFNRGLKALSGVPTVSVRNGKTGAFTTAPLTSAGTDESGQVYSHTLTPGACRSVVQWYYTAMATDGSTVTAPPGGAGAPFEAVVNTWATVFADDFQANLGWSVGDPASPDTAGTGLWARGDPNGYQGQVEFDHTPLAGTNCFFTGQNAPGSSGADVGGAGYVTGGKTTLRSPVMDLTGATSADLSFWLSFFNDPQYPPLDPLVVEITNNAGAASPTWVPAVTIAANAPVSENSGHWKKYTIPVTGLITPTSTVQMRVVVTSAASDLSGNGNWVEAAIDDVSMISYSCRKSACAGDFNGDGSNTVQDIFDFLAAYFSASPSADFNHSGTTTVQDIFDFLAAWFAGCA